jgi:hypothetical protein
LEEAGYALNWEIQKTVHLGMRDTYYRGHPSLPGDLFFFCVYIDYSDGAWRTGIYLLHMNMRRTEESKG